jgi:hypothetical protein
MTRENNFSFFFVGNNARKSLQILRFLLSLLREKKHMQIIGRTKLMMREFFMQIL